MRATNRSTNPHVNHPDFIVGFKPESTEAPAHFFVATGNRAVCASPLELSEYLEHELFAPLAIALWEQLTGVHDESPQLIGAIIVGWTNALKAHNEQLRATRH
jgi:hypothetical protein